MRPRPILHVFPYSARNGTPAARMPQVARAQREERARRAARGGRRGAGRISSPAASAGSSRCWSSAAARPHRGVRAVRIEGTAAAGRQRASPCASDRRRQDATLSGPAAMSRGDAGLAGSSACAPASAGPRPRSATTSPAIITRKRSLDKETLDELEEALIAADLGVETAALLVEDLGRDRFGKEVSEQEVRKALADSIAGHAGAGRPASRSRSEPSGRR